MGSSRSFLLYILLGFSGQRNLLITANVVKRKALWGLLVPSSDHVIGRSPARRQAGKRRDNLCHWAHPPRPETGTGSGGAGQSAASI